ncbi:hypothetical protein, partial [Acinetobacter nosocomialis]
IIPIINKLDQKLETLIEFNSSVPKLIDTDTALDLLKEIENTLKFDENVDTLPFNWDMAYAALIHLSHQNQDESQRGKIWLWTAKDRNLKKPSITSNAHIADSPDSKT